MASLGHIILNVSDFKKSSLFYDCLMEVLDFRVDYIDEGDWGIMKSYKNGEHNIWIRKDAKSKSKEFVRNVGLDHLAFKVNELKYVSEIYEEMKALGSKITIQPKAFPEYSPNYYAFYFRDPDNIPLEIYFE